MYKIKIILLKLFLRSKLCLDRAFINASFYYIFIALFNASLVFRYKEFILSGLSKILSYVFWLNFWSIFLSLFTLALFPCKILNRTL